VTKLIGHIRNNAVGYIALTVALGGTSYGATKPSASRAQAQSPTIHVAGDRQLINGNVRGWAIVGPAGRVVASGGKPEVTGLIGDPGGYGIRWRVKVGRCATVATIDLRLSRPTESVAIPGNSAVSFTAGYAVGSTTRTGTVIQTFNQQGQPTPLGFDIVLIC
jgi:hypothetical protein